MLDKNHQEYVRNAKKLYKEIGHLMCPAFNNEKIYFNREGFNHLLWKGDSYRDISEQQDRLTLVPFAVSLLGKCKKYSTYRKSFSKGVTAQFWSFDTVIENKSISVIVRQINEGGKHFFSVFYKT